MWRLFFEVDFQPMLIEFFDLNSSSQLDEKIKVMAAMKENRFLIFRIFMIFWNCTTRKRFTGIENTAY